MQLPPFFIMPSDAKMELRTPRLRLRPTRADDAPLLWPHVGDHELTRYLTWDPHKDEAVTRDFLESTVRGRLKSHEATWLIFEEGQFRGLVSLGNIQRHVMGVEMHKAELGYWIGRPYHGRGLMTEAAGAAVAFAFRTLVLHKVFVRAVTPNKASLRVIEKLGFSLVGTMRREVKRRGRWYDLSYYEMLRDEPSAKRLLATHL